MTVGYALSNIGVQIPVLAVLLVGLILTLNRRARLPNRSAGPLTAGLAVLLIGHVAQVVWSIVSIQLLESYSARSSYTAYGVINWMVYAVLTLFLAVGFILLILGLLRTAGPPTSGSVPPGRFGGSADAGPGWSPPQPPPSGTPDWGRPGPPADAGGWRQTGPPPANPPTSAN